MTDRRFGRLVDHDERSKLPQYRAATLPALRDVKHRRYGAVLDQGETGSCVGHAAAHDLNSAPLHLNRQHNLTHADALDVYSKATAIDAFPGSYPPDDTGTSALAAGKALVRSGKITAYHHAFGIAEVLAALMLRPVMLGTWWYEGMMHGGTLRPTGAQVGGHEYLANGYDAEGKRVRILNSWGAGWGDRGMAWITVDDLASLLDDDGDAMVLVR